MAPFPSLSMSRDPEPASKKRRRSQEANDDVISALKGARRPRGRPRVANKTPLSATQEIRMLRAQVACMEAELHGLETKWTRELPDQRTLATAQHTARKKREVALTEAAHMELEEMLLQQQLMFATLQAAIFQAPLHSSGKDLYKALHFDTRLGRDRKERNSMLKAHNERALATVPSIMRRFTQMGVDKVLALQEQGASNKSVLPLSQIGITGCKDHTLVSSVFMSEIPHNSLEDVYAASLAYHDAIPSTMKRHFGIDATRTRLNGDDEPASYWRLSLDGAGLPATVNHVVCSELTPSHGMVHVDAVIDDPLHPVTRTSPLEFGISGLTMTPRKEPLTGRTVAITLRWVVVYRYKLLPDDPALRKDLEIIRPIFNGDLITASVCGYIQELQRRPRS
ncbi:hypothetical protein PHYSODRAFT_517133 [Phytophthora sojae]|uniref:Uncharacterized protein n=1 Tax=Phytophthora sojae (strain P6497) TaxID=1094619 RepID=G4ZYL3_PHYSP|nr:hypothetical protein PHYSODRAFT_517133 [Phytophthora sojae]EGZ12046.1 hypothetical protein PHYSODRAFT_517133 [Phytophthora sojae]|eukprot:XP_009532379.1 hypothetical protein PHYSODRAFT_517133 [Phytophthora sojae]